MIGQLVGNYKIIAKLGEGGMGEVFKGLDLMLEREVAIKMLRPELARQQAIVERFRAEAIILAKLNHPNIATLYNFVRQDQDYFMIMEYVKGQTFESLIKQEGAMPYQSAVQLFAQALEGIAHAHQLGIIHRDLKPANVMLMDAGLIKVMDFGIARVLGSNRITRTGNVVGTIGYMSPEQIRGQVTDARSDIYSAGIMLYEMLTGRRPFECNSGYEWMRRQVEEAPEPPSRFAKQLPLAIERIIMRALAKRPDARFQTADEFRAVLGKSLSSETAIWVKASVGVAQQDQKPSNDSPSMVDSPKDFASLPAKSGIATKLMPTTLDFTSEPQSSGKENALPKVCEAQAVLQDAGLAEEVGAFVTYASEAKAEWVTQQFRETRLTGSNRGQGAQVWHQQAQLSYSSPENSQTTLRQEKPSPVASFINKLNWSHYVAAILLVLLSIPVALISGFGDSSRANQAQSVSTMKLPTLPEAKSEPAAQPPSSSSSGQPASTDPAPNVNLPVTRIPAGAGSQEATSENSRNKNRPRRASSRQPSPANEPAKEPMREPAKEPAKEPANEPGKQQDNAEAGKKEEKRVEPKVEKKVEQKAEQKVEKKKEKKGGFFEKLKKWF
jgi:serine/threonine protein kinase